MEGRRGSRLGSAEAVSARAHALRCVFRCCRRCSRGLLEGGQGSRLALAEAGSTGARLLMLYVLLLLVLTSLLWLSLSQVDRTRLVTSLRMLAFSSRSSFLASGTSSLLPPTNPLPIDSSCGYHHFFRHEKSLLSFLRVRNRSTSEISVSISVRGIRRRDFVKGELL